MLDIDLFKLYNTLIMYTFGKNLCFIHLVIIIGTEGCSNNWHLFEGNCYYFSSNKLTWFHATQACSDEHAWLVDIESRNEQEFLRHTIKQLHVHDSIYLGYWTSGNDLAIEGRWIWGYPGELTFNYTDWAPPEPNNHLNREEDCVAIVGRYGYDFKWNDEPCDVQESYICKQEDVRNVVG